MIKDIISDETSNEKISEAYSNLYDKLFEIKDDFLTEDTKSPIRSAIHKAYYEVKPMLVVVALGYCYDTNYRSAIYSAIVEEFRRTVVTIRDKESVSKKKMNIGLYVDNIGFFSIEKHTAYNTTLEAIYRWYRSLRVMAIYATKSNTHLPSILKDKINMKKDGV